MKKVLFILVIVFLAGCASSDSNQSKREELKNLKTELQSIQAKIELLENDLDNDSESDNGSLAIPVAVKTLQAETFNHFFEVSGSIEAVNYANISPELSGQIKKIFVEEGQRVKKGEVLAKINTSILESSIDGVETGLEMATIVFEKQQKLWDKKIGSEIEYLTAKNAKDGLENQLSTLKAQLELASIKAPFGGIVDNINQKVGDLASPGVPMMQLVNLNKLYINADVSESHLPALNKGDMVEVSFPVFSNLILKEPIFRISNIIDPQNRSVSIQLKINNKNEMLKPNGLAMIKINDFSSDSALVVPSIIIKQDMTGFFLYISKMENGKLVAKKRYVKSGVSYKDESMITEGISAGECVIIDGYNQVSDGTLIEIG